MTDEQSAPGAWEEAMRYLTAPQSAAEQALEARLNARRLLRPYHARAACIGWETRRK